MSRPTWTRCASRSGGPGSTAPSSTTRTATASRTPGEKGIPHQLLTVRERSNALYLHGTNIATTDENGHYELRGVYPLGQWLALEQYADGYKTTGITWQAAQEKTATTKLGEAVDVNFLPWIGQGATIDWGKKPYTSSENGGIVGVVSYGTTRNELDPDEAVTEDWQPGVAGVTMHIYRAVRDANGDVVHNPDGSVQVEGQAADGSGTPTDIGPTYRPSSGTGPSTARASTPRATGSPIPSWPTTPRSRPACRCPPPPGTTTASRRSAAA